MKETQQNTTWTVYAPEEQRITIIELLDELNNIMAEEAGVEGLQIPKGKLIINALRTTIELKNPSGLRR